MEAAGIEPAGHKSVTADSFLSCELCIQFSAANALHPESIECLQTAFADADLRKVILSWTKLPDVIQSYILELVLLNN